MLWLLTFFAFVAAAPVLYFFFGLFCARSGSSDLPTIYAFTSPVYMFAGFFSFVAVMLAIALHRFITGHRIFFMPIYSTDPTSTDLTIFWSLMSLAAFSPVIVVLLSRYIRRDEYAAA